MNTLMCYKTMPKWCNDSLPKAFRNRHNTKEGTWAKLTIFSGKLKYYTLNEDDTVIDTYTFDSNSDVPFIEPQAWHKVEPLTEDLRCQLSFYCMPDDYYQKKYNLSATHSEVLATLEIMKKDIDKLSGLSVLDLGCGSGRNSLHLQKQGFAVTACDKNEKSIDRLHNIIEQEDLNNIDVKVADLQALDTISFDKAPYDLAISTVVLMFLDGEKVPAVIDAMQQNTKIGGYHTIVCAMNSEDYPYPDQAGLLPFYFGFKAGELADYYKDWDMVKYNEDVGHLHRLDNEGNPIALRFATLIARKVT